MIHDRRGPSMRQMVKHELQRMLVDTGIAALARKWQASSGVILAYHNIIPAGEASAGERVLHMPQAEFARQLDRLTETHEIIRLDQLPCADESDRPYAAITFDDAYRGALTAGLDELRARDLPATYFVCPGLLDGRTFWWDAIASREAGLLPAKIRRLALSELEGRQDRILQWADREGIRRGAVPPYCRSASYAELSEAAGEPGITIGSHTWSHPNLKCIDAGEGRRDLKSARKWLTRNLSSVIPWLAYPYGLAPTDAPGLLPAGEEFALTIESRLIDVENLDFDPRLLPRVNISASLSLSRFELLVSGL